MLAETHDDWLGDAESGEWIPRFRELAVFDAQDRELERSWEAWRDGRWVPSWPRGVPAPRILTTYDGTGLHVEEVRQTIDYDGTLINDRKIESTTDVDGNLLLQLRSDWIDGALTVPGHTVYTLDEQGHCTLELD